MAVKKLVLKEGLTVKLKPLSVLRFARDVGPNFIDDMDRFAGKKVTVNHVFRDGTFNIREDKKSYQFGKEFIDGQPLSIDSLDFDIGPIYGTIDSEGTISFHNDVDEIPSIVLTKLFKTQQAFLRAQKQLESLNAKIETTSSRKKTTSKKRY
jgi:hypothetical protein